MPNSLENNATLLSLIRQSKVSRDKVIYELYYDKRLRANFTKMMQSMHPDPNTFETIFNQSLMQFVSTVIKRPDFELQLAYYSYITVIGKHAYVKYLKSKEIYKEPLHFVEQWKTIDEPEKLMIDIEKKEIIFELLGKIGLNCREVLLLWANGFNMTEIASKLNYKSEGMARKKKYQCSKEFGQLLEDNPHYKSLLES